MLRTKLGAQAVQVVSRRLIDTLTESLNPLRAENRALQAKGGLVSPEDQRMASQLARQLNPLEKRLELLNQIQTIATAAVQWGDKQIDAGYEECAALVDPTT